LQLQAAYPTAFYCAVKRGEDERGKSMDWKEERRYERAKLSELKRKVLNKISVNEHEGEIKFFCEDGTEYLMYHSQECCENVSIEEIIGNIEDLIGSPIIMAEESTNSDNPKEHSDESFTWTFYKFSTVKGYVTIRWYGESNGYYSESVDFKKLSKTNRD
jgi:(p)ppGpp synthase/HD superfamily hydrolase